MTHISEESGFYQPSRAFRFRRFCKANGISIVLLAVGCLAIIGACAVAVYLMGL